MTPSLHMWLVLLCIGLVFTFAHLLLLSNLVCDFCRRNLFLTMAKIGSSLILGQSNHPCLSPRILLGLPRLVSLFHLESLTIMTHGSNKLSSLQCILFHFLPHGSREPHAYFTNWEGLPDIKSHRGFSETLLSQPKTFFLRFYIVLQGFPPLTHFQPTKLNGRHESMNNIY